MPAEYPRGHSTEDRHGEEVSRTKPRYSAPAMKPIFASSVEGQSGVFPPDPGGWDLLAGPPTTPPPTTQPPTTPPPTTPPPGSGQFWYS